MKKNIKINALCIGLLLLLSCGGPQHKGSSANAKQDTTNTLAEAAPQAKAANTASAPTENTPSAIAQSNKKGSLKGFATTPLVLLVIVIVGIICVIIIYALVRYFKGLVEDIKYVKGKIFRMSDRLNYLENKTIDMQNEITRLKTAPAPPSSTANHPAPLHRIEDAPVETAPVATAPTSKLVSEYLAFQSGMQLVRANSQDSAFYQVQYTPGENKGKFWFDGKATKAIKNKSAVLDNVCEYDSFSSAATQIITVQKGTCVRQADGTWLVTEKTKISFK